VKQLKKDIKNGLSKEKAFENYEKRANADTKKASRYLAYIPDSQLLKKYSIPNYALIFIFGLLTAGIIIQSLSVLFTSSNLYILLPVFIIELSLYVAILYLLIKGNAVAYLLVAFLTIRTLGKPIGNYLNEPNTATITPIVIIISMIILAIFIKLKLFPYQNLFHTKKDYLGNILFSSERKSSQTLKGISEDILYEQPPKSKTPNKQKTRTKLLFVFTVIVVVVFFVFKSYSNKQQNAKYEEQDAQERQFAPNFNTQLLSLEDTDQSDFLKEYKLQGYNLRCFSNLRSREKIGKNNDYLCWAIIKNAYDNIPARQVAFFFYKKKLVHVRLELPNSSHFLLQKYLATNMFNRPRLDHVPGNTLDDSLISWKADNGIIVTEKNPDDNIIILWSSEKTLSAKEREEFKNIKG